MQELLNALKTLQFGGMAVYPLLLLGIATLVIPWIRLLYTGAMSSYPNLCYCWLRPIVLHGPTWMDS